MSPNATSSQIAYDELECRAKTLRNAISNGDVAQCSEMLEKLRSDAATAAETLVTYDQRKIDEIIKQLSDELTKLRQRRPKFTFRTRAKTTSVKVKVESNSEEVHANNGERRKDEQELCEGWTKRRALITGKRNALRIRQTASCMIVIRDPVIGSVLLRECHNCVIVLTARQIRVHDCANCYLFIDCTTAPVIERCNHMVFAPRCRAPSNDSHEIVALNDENSEQVVQVSAEMWRDVKDFNWLRSTPSPNWRVLNNDEVVSVDIVTGNS